MGTQISSARLAIISYVNRYLPSSTLERVIRLRAGTLTHFCWLSLAIGSAWDVCALF